MKFRLSLFPEVFRTPATVQDKSFMKLDKEEAKHSPRRKLGLSESLSLLSLGQIAISLSNFERLPVLSSFAKD